MTNYDPRDDYDLDERDEYDLPGWKNAEPPEPEESFWEHRDVVFWVVVGLLLLAILSAIMSATNVFAHDAAAMRDPVRGAWFSSLKMPGTNGSCCNMEDCERTDARQLDDQSWEALMVDALGKHWVKIPPNKVIKEPKSVDGEAYLCHSQGDKGGVRSSLEGGKTYNASPSEGLIYCFVPPVPGF